MSSPVKDEAKKLIDELPDAATWEDVMYTVYVREAIERGMEDERRGRLLEHEEVERRIFERLHTP
jgi:predicted transcriptional regulator